MGETKHIVIIVPPMTSILDIAGPLEVFTKTIEYIHDNVSASTQSYTTHVVSATTSTYVATTAGLPVVCEGNLSSIHYEIDTVILAGKGDLDPDDTELKPLVNWLTENAGHFRRICSICAGAYMLAEAGLLNGRRATTHWRNCDNMAKRYPAIIMEKDPIYIKDGNIYTSAGISTGMDLSLALVEEDFGRDIAVNVARILVLYLKRPGNQSQFSNILMYQKVDYEPIQHIQEWILEHLYEDLSVEMLAEKALMSPRNFARVFLRETGITPAKYIEKMRLETARRRLEETRLTIDEISSECGIGNADGLRRLFLRHMKTTPSDYRKSFSTALN
ncbi:GlxA family transcriptional regulator [Microbacter margulisiae]|uniref:Transcriptional regulator GlxA family with amidase domain n=1 Tax=Microbacter margulisiae TaxID=1350067 RepID=A0A7W5DS95_9PORP|nr:GlxA family transcriptional regulator [Microbacter margulisiae]MBB3187659.1 transcriptional regulator GlxA family with amidase domain [Microbacter margulisiae]